MCSFLKFDLGAATSSPPPPFGCAPVYGTWI